MDNKIFESLTGLLDVGLECKIVSAGKHIQELIEKMEPEDGRKYICL
jgi:hypothetical protein